MTFEERLDRMADRHQALAETVELIASMQRDLTREVRELRAAIHEDAVNIRALARIAEIHEPRLTDLEGGE